MFAGFLCSGKNFGLRWKYINTFQKPDRTKEAERQDIRSGGNIDRCEAVNFSVSMEEKSFR